MNIENTTPFIMFSRLAPDWIFNDSKLFTLLAYCARRARRATLEEYQLDNGQIIRLDIGEFMIGRHAVARDTDLTEQEYRTRWKKLQELHQVEQVKTTSHYTIGKLVSSSIFDINMDISNQQLTNDQPTVNQLPTTNNNDKKDNNEIAAVETLEQETEPVRREASEADAAFSEYVAYALAERQAGGKVGNPHGLKKKIFQDDQADFHEAYSLISSYNKLLQQASSEDRVIADRATRFTMALSSKLRKYPDGMIAFIRKWRKDRL